MLIGIVPIPGGVGEWNWAIGGVDSLMMMMCTGTSGDLHRCILSPRLAWAVRLRVAQFSNSEIASTELRSPIAGSGTFPGGRTQMYPSPWRSSNTGAAVAICCTQGGQVAENWAAHLCPWLVNAFIRGRGCSSVDEHLLCIYLRFPSSSRAEEKFLSANLAS